MDFNFGQAYNSLGIVESTEKKKTYISSPYWSLSNNLVVMMSQPIYDKTHQYLGMISGAIYLQKNNLINTMLNTQYDYKKSYMYVIDQHNRIIFHPDKKRIGEKIINNTGLDYINNHRKGSIRLKNSLGIDNLAGFAHIPSVKWIVVSQQPTDDLLAQANTLILKVSIGISFFYLFIFLLVWYISSFISSPLNRLARMASMLNQAEIQDKIKEESRDIQLTDFTDNVIDMCMNTDYDHVRTKVEFLEGFSISPKLLGLDISSNSSNNCIA